MVTNISVASANALGVPVDQPHSLQAIIELTYVRAANDILYSRLSSLEEALAIAQNAISALAQLQTLHNSVVPVAKPPFSSVFNINRTDLSITAYRAAYTAAASAYYGTPVKISAQFPSGFPAFQTSILSLKSAISTNILPILSQTRSPASGPVNPNSLLAMMRKVLGDLNNSAFHGFASAGDGAKWIIDNYNSATNSGSTSSGAIQNNITNAITSGEAQNTTLTQQVRSYLFLFEQYYKSAAAMLTQITQIIQQMAQGISKS